MADSAVKSLPAQARNRIDKLERSVSELKGTLDVLIAEMRRQGLAFPVQRSRALKAAARHGEPVLTGRKLPSFAAPKAINKASGLAAAVARGEAAKVEWVQSGEVIPAQMLADVWGLTPQALGPAAERGEVFAVVVKRQRYYPREFLDLDRQDVGAVCKALGNLSPAEKLVFWKRPHGALKGKTVFAALTDARDADRLRRVEVLARAWADEAHAGRDAAKAA